MTPGPTSRFPAAGREFVAGAVYFGIVAALAASSLWFLGDLLARSEGVAGAEKELDRLTGGSRLQPGSNASEGNGSPFLDGKTVTIAGAALEQRIGEVIGKAGGVLTSAQVELDGPDAKRGFVGLTTSMEVSQAALQEILYDIEAGLPYLFVEKLSIQSPGDFGEPETGRMRMTMSVSGQWLPGE